MEILSIIIIIFELSIIPFFIYLLIKYVKKIKLIQLLISKKIDNNKLALNYYLTQKILDYI